MTFVLADSMSWIWGAWNVQIAWHSSSARCAMGHGRLCLLCTRSISNLNSLLSTVAAGTGEMPSVSSTCRSQQRVRALLHHDLPEHQRRFGSHLRAELPRHASLEENRDRDHICPNS